MLWVYIIERGDPIATIILTEFIAASSSTLVRARRVFEKDKRTEDTEIIMVLNAMMAMYNSDGIASHIRAFRAWQRAVFPLPPNVFTHGFPEPGSAEFVNAVTVIAALVAVVCVMFDIAMRVRATLAADARRKKNKNKKKMTTLPADGSDVTLALSKREQISPDTLRLTFALPTEKHTLGLPVGQHVGIAFVDEKGERHERPYTPTSSDDDLGVVVFVIKVYKPCEKFPLGGNVTQRLDALKVGDTCKFYGPKGMKTYAGRGKFLVKRLKSQGGGFETRACKSIGMIAGGSGITPMLQISRAILDNGDRVPMSLLFANQTEADILCREEIEADVAKHGEGKFKAHYTLDRPPKKGWKYSSGFITKEMIAEHMPPPGKNTQILICGPPPMLKFAVMPALEALGYTKEMVLTW